ncbi:hypothetical protein A3K48_00955 [candidate division WOR-1 bacterium RIFOXYA12_FULL_52_29]|uniref:Uncharacterized protein n=1 Tax=candidate division WOR-1 bacterium RIFOXYC12_FULL_54_18 TaxID=1802584 RepID=A0A1F4T4F4_UNCSA|nr:MAG: hypothetical protein A3K44_00955 [candidate division WOR-1 bacterium RIFOXYA2_FULL_51_19]OGC17161.1 MAG: hypothetical protein A3K48_00955 [candidate division WOR-1 bacterium RIFOXYA12_FULL_52_29]OGC26021.1 MAG: hypothetical protein A3K32_00950 [candidate division WOR-1 bacterium RIFOXYB2_FULL_45_9]OGC27578.1 MAG: hypothetical protein A3K49_00955 [candidate division WOR-1 bacterium RIFOXYC12_FULL_54_18]OGC29209.1 MAG: hypothetical protein A2346_00755 [candidate division WOR-1 bacterium R
MTNSPNIGTQLNNSERFYAAAFRNPALSSLAARETGEQRPGDATRETGLSWDSDSKGEQSINSGITDTLTLSTSTVSRSSSIISQPLGSVLKSQGKLQQFREQLIGKLLDAYGDVFRNTFHWNLPLANMAKWSIDNIFNRLSILGVEQTKLDQIKTEVTTAMRSENRGNMRQVVQTEAYQEVGIA